MKITAIVNLPDYHLMGPDFLILPDGMDFESERHEYAKWFVETWYPAYKAGHNLPYRDLVRWLKDRGAVEPTDDQLDVVELHAPPPYLDEIEGAEGRVSTEDKP